MGKTSLKSGLEHFHHPLKFSWALLQAISTPTPSTRQESIRFWSPEVSHSWVFRTLCSLWFWLSSTLHNISEIYPLRGRFRILFFYCRGAFRSTALLRCVAADWVVSSFGGSWITMLHIRSRGSVFTSLEWIPGSGVAGCHDKFCASRVKTLFSSAAVPFYFPTSQVWGFHPLHILVSAWGCLPFFSEPFHRLGSFPNC